MYYPHNIFERFVVLEGIDGSGKSCQISAVKKYFNNNYPNINVFCTREPTGSHIGFAIKQLLKEPKSPFFTESKYDEMLTFLFLGDRYNHLYGHNGIIENLQSSQETVVISDRYLFSSLVYQDLCGCNFYLNSILPMPRLVFFLEIEPKIAIQRIENTDTMETKENLEKAAKKYKTVLKQYMKISPATKFITIDASMKKEDVTQEIVSHLPMFFGV